MIYEAEEPLEYLYDDLPVSQHSADHVDRTLRRPPSVASEDLMYDDDIDMDCIPEAASPMRGTDSAMANG